MSIKAYFNANIGEIESSPMTYAGFQKIMVGQAIIEQPTPNFCQLVTTMWPK